MKKITLRKGAAWQLAKRCSPNDCEKWSAKEAGEGVTNRTGVYHDKKCLSVHIAPHRQLKAYMSHLRFSFLFFSFPILLLRLDDVGNNESMLCKGCIQLRRNGMQVLLVSISIDLSPVIRTSMAWRSSILVPFSAAFMLPESSAIITVGKIR